ncbi:hypothetical protein Tco_1514807 [Tanacetum coccineum]
MSSDSASFEVTYTSISSHRDPLAWVVDLFGLQESNLLEAAQALPDYVPGPEEPEQAPLSPDYVPRPEYLEYLAPSDKEIVVEDQPYADYASPDAVSPRYVTDLDPEEDFEDGPLDYLADRGDDDDDDDSSDDDEEEEEEHLAPVDSVVAPAVDPVPSFEETEPFETDESAATPPPPADHTTPLGARISIRPQAPMPFPSEAEVERLLALPTPPPSPLISLSPPSAEECLARCLAAPALPSSPLPKVPYPYCSPNHVRAPRGFRAAMGRLRASSPSTHNLLHPSPPLSPLPSSLYLPPLVPISLPLPSPPLPASLFIPPPVDCREEIPKAELPPRKRLCMTALTSRFEAGESSTTAARPTRGHRADYGFIDLAEAVEEVAPMTLEGVNARVTELAEVQEEDTHDLYALVEDAQDRQTHLSQRVNILIEDKEFHQEIVLLMEQEALDYRIASHESLTATLVAQISLLQGQLSAALGQIQALQARDPTHADDPESADSSSAANNMPPKRTSAAAARAAAAVASMTATDVEQLIEARVFEALANHETLQNI